MGLGEMAGILFQGMLEHQQAPVKGGQMTVIEQELEDLGVAGQVILTDAPEGGQPGLEQGPDSLGSVLVDCSTRILASAVVDGLVVIADLLQEAVTLGGVRVDSAAGGNGLGHYRLQALATHIGDDGQDGLALFAAHHRDHGRAILGRAPSSPSSLFAPPPRGEKSGLCALRQEPAPCVRL